MDSIIKKIKSINKEYLSSEKILIMPSYSEGSKLMHWLAAEGITLFNFKVKTLFDLLKEGIANHLYRQQLTIIDGRAAKMLLYKIIKGLLVQDQLEYFQRLEYTPGVTGSIYGSIYELRMNGYTAVDLNENDFIRVDKGRDFIKILQRYEDLLGKDKLADEASLYRLSILPNKEDQYDKSIKGPDKVYLIPVNLKLRYLEEKFLDNLLNEGDITVKNPAGQAIRKFIISLGLIPGLPKYSNPLAYLYDLDYYDQTKGSGDLLEPDIVLKRAYGESNEVREVFREIKRKQLQLDETVVYYTQQEPYCQLFYSLSQQYNLPVTFADGVNIINTRPAKLYFLLLDWLKNDYSESILRQMLNTGLIEIKEGNLCPERIAAILRRLGIGRGRERYLQVLAKELKRTQGQNQLLLADLKGVRDFLLKIFSLVPELDQVQISGLIHERIDSARMARGLIRLIKSYARISGEGDREARELIINQLKLLIDYPEDLNLKELIELSTGLIKGTRVGVSLPRPGHLHLSSLQKGNYLHRKNNFVIGLDASRFPGQDLEDPILLDIEREKLGRLELKRNRPQEVIYETTALLANMQGSIYFSYPCYDTVEDRENTPATILLKIYRLISGNPEADYSEFINSLPRPAGFLPYKEEAILNETEYWLYQSKYQGIEQPLRTFSRLYSNTGQGYWAWQQRMERSLNQYSGLVIVNSAEVDPRFNHQEIVSASRLELIASCPYKYFLQYLLNIKLPDELQYEPGQWLDPLMRGSLLHRVFELFYRDLLTEGEKPKLKEHQQDLYELAEELLTKQQEELPPPGEFVYQQEAREILQSCRIFLASEEENYGGAVPVNFELDFGSNNPVMIELNDGSNIKVRGRIDRVDQLGEHRYQIIDYKTGSTYGYSKRDYIKKGRQLQHVLYALALEKLLGDKAQVELTAYVFPAVRGEGQRFMRAASDASGKREEAREIIGVLLDLLSAGVFVMTDNKSDCVYCDYRLICEPESLNQIMVEIRKDSNDPYITALRGLNDYA